MSTDPTGRPGVLSVCIPTWNAAPWIQGTLERLLRQKGRELDVVVCDDASGDETCALARRVGGSRVRVIENEERRGLSGNWNRAIRHAQGEHLCLFGQDDIAYPGWADTLCGLLDAYPEAVLAFGRRDFHFETEDARGEFEYFAEEYPGLIDGAYERLGTYIEPRAMVREAMRLGFLLNLVGEPSFAVVRRSHPAVRQGFDERFRQLVDWEFYTRLFTSGPVVRTDVVVGAYRIHKAAASYANRNDGTAYREQVPFLEMMEERFRPLLGWRGRLRLRRRRRGVLRWQAEERRRAEERARREADAPAGERPG